jgi:hypothetical protein
VRHSLPLLCALSCAAQDFTQRGFLETKGYFYPQRAPNDSGRIVGESLLRYEVSRAIVPGLRLFGAFDARVDTHQQVERSAEVNYLDRNSRRPALSVRRVSALYTRGNWTIEAGKQLIRWGKADILNPTDRFAPRDFLNVVDTEVFGVTAARVTYETASNSIEMVWQPVFTPSRTPLLNQRWAVIPEALQSFTIRDGGSSVPGGSQFGARLNHLGRGYEASLSFYDGHNHLPLLDSRLTTPAVIDVRRFFPQLRLYGADAAIPLSWLTIKGEAAWFTSATREADEYLLYVIQLERQSGEWSFVGGYAGEVVTQRNSQLDFAPDRGLTRAFLGRAGYTIDANRDISFEGVVRQNLKGALLRAEYSQAFGRHWRATTGFALIRGDPTDFLGQYRRNSHFVLKLRYSF